MSRRALAYATAPPSTVVAGQSYTVSVTVTNQSTLLGAPAAYSFVVQFQLFAQVGAIIGQVDSKSYNVWIGASGQAHVNYTFTAPATGYNSGYVKVKLLNTAGTTAVGTTLQSSDFTITADLIPGGSIGW